jgi:hypothetical protein
MNQDSSRPWPEEVPIAGIVPAGWQSVLRKEGGTIDKRLWEIGLALAVRDALRSGNPYLPDNRWQKHCRGLYQTPIAA